jgi:signal transduction histidine kinase/DNA-binding response OmpR family regulator/ligand-binding sensor domain-containing protein
MNKRITTFLLFLLFAVSLWASDVVAFRHYTTADGLSSNQVNAVFRDSKGVLWVGTGAGLDRYDAYRFNQFLQEDGLPGLYVTRLAEDTQGQIWVYTTEGMACYSYEKDCFLSPEQGLKAMGIRASAPTLFGGSPDHSYFWVAEDHVLSVYSAAQKRVLAFSILSENAHACALHRDNLYFLDADGLLRRANLFSGLVETLEIPAHLGRYTRDRSVLQLYVDNMDGLWMYTGMNGWLLHREANGSWEVVDLIQPGHASTGVIDMAQDSAGNLWVASSHMGLFCIGQDGSIRQIRNNPDQNFSLLGDRVSALHIDEDDIVWVGIGKLGLSSYTPWSQALLHFHIPGADDILSICETPGGLYLGTNGTGLWRADRFDGTFSQVTSAPSIISCLVLDGEGNMWVGTWSQGVMCMDPVSGRVKVHYTRAHGLLTNIVVSVLPGEDGYIYIGHYQGVVQRINPQSGEIVTLYEDRSVNLRDLSFVNDSTLVVAASTGLLSMSPATGELKPGPVLPEGMNSSVLFKDHQNTLWIAGRRGVWYWNAQNNELTQLKEYDGRPVRAARGVTEDLYGRIWISTTHGMMAIDRSGDESFIRHYGTRDGLGLSEFNARSIITLRQGAVLAGTPRGISVLQPQSGYSSAFDAHIYLTSVDYAGEDHTEISRVPRLEDKEMVITNSMLPLSLYFSCLDYTTPDAITYQYRIKGFSDRWTTMLGNSVRFSVLPPGKYELTVRACNDQNIWSPYMRSLTLVVRPPWYRSIWAILVYILLVGGVAFWLLRLAYRRRELAAAMERVNKEAENQQKLVDMKLTFFSGVSHELRTPLSLIINPLEEFVKRYPQYREGFLDTARHNAVYLKELIDELLSFRKMDAGGEKMVYTHQDIISVLKEVFVSFQTIAEKRKISYTFDAPESSVEMDFDRDKMTKILRNLISNAFKFTPDAGSVAVSVRLSGQSLQVSVSDTGPGIAEEERENVFKMFYQSESNAMGGSGIGLYLVDQYVSMHEGSIKITDNTPHGAVFTFAVPVRSSLAPEAGTEAGFQDIKVPEKVNRLPGPTILLVDDNAEFLDFLMTSLSERYEVLRATDGFMALDILREREIGLVISDVMMPNMDGMELCRSIKADVHTSHIPVILLTAKSGEEFQLEGLRQGADDYVTKPFNMDILLNRIEKLIAKGEASEPTRVDVTSLDQQFVKKAVRVVEEHMSNADFSVEDLAASLSISRGYLYRKITTITGKSAIEFIRTIRMKRAQQFLAESQLQIAEVAYQLGYHSPKTFARHFRQVFGMSPSEYIRSFKS